MAKRRIVVLGGAISGPAAAARARETDEQAAITLVERSRDVSYAACALAYHVSGEVPSLEALNRERAEFFWDVYRVRVLTGAPARAIDAAARRVALEGVTLPYDALIYALGAESLLPRAPGFAGARNLFRFRTLVDLEALLSRLQDGGKRVAVLGGGFIGVEAADGLARRGCKVTLIEHRDRVLPAFSPAASGAAEAALARMGVTVMARRRVTRALRRGGAVSALRLAGARTVPVDAVVAAIGLSPRTELLARAGGRLHADASAAIDDRCRTSLPAVFACGVCVSVPRAVGGTPAWTPQAALADRTAQVAGACAAGGDARLWPAAGTAVVRAGDLTLGRTGLSHAEAEEYAGGECAVTRVNAPSRDAFFPGAEDMHVELLHHPASGRLLGAEVFGGSGADKRLDVLAAAIAGGLTVDHLGGLDLGYAPPFAPVRDPVNVAGTVAAATRARLAEAVSAAELARQRARVTVVDVRPANSRAAPALTGSVSMPLAALRKEMGRLQGPVVFVCDTGRLSYLAARIATQRGVVAAYLSGGLAAWGAEGHR